MSKKTRKSKQAATVPNPQSSGRPCGSPNIERPTAIAIPARCPTCQSTRHQVKPGIAPQVLDHAGVNPLTGQTYTYVVWRSVICECGQNFRTREETNHDPRNRQ